MSDQVTQDERPAAAGAPPPRRNAGRRGLITVVAVVLAVLLVAAGALAIGLLTDGAEAPSGDATAASPTVSAPSASTAPTGGRLEVSGSGVGAHRFGADADEVVADLTARYGDPDESVGPQQYVRIAGHQGWYEVADDPISPSWRYPVVSVSCWSVLCVVLGGQEADSLQLRGWTLVTADRGSGAGRADGLRAADVRLADSGIRLGDTWGELHAAYPDTVAAGGEGASLTVRELPWAGVFDGVGEWRLSGQWDHERPDFAPDDAVVTRLSAGEGPQPGCC